MSAVLEAVRAGRAGETALLVRKLTDAERRALLPELQALRKGVTLSDGPTLAAKVANWVRSALKASTQ